jgi:GxxExxY protein
MCLNLVLKFIGQWEPGLLESVYEDCLKHELSLRNIKVDSQVIIPVHYKDFKIERNFKVDLLIENEIIVELKSCKILLPIHPAQLISYLKLADKKMGFLVNFNVGLIKNGFKKFVNEYNYIHEGED